MKWQRNLNTSASGLHIKQGLDDMNKKLVKLQPTFGFTDGINYIETSFRIWGDW
jgi:hypothetical protein